MRRLAIMLVAIFAAGSSYAQESGTPCVSPELDSDRAQHLELVQTLRDTESEIRDVRFSLDGRFVAAAANDGQARIWDINSGRVVMRTREMGSPIWYAGFSGDGRRLLTYVTGERYALYEWDINTGEGRLTEDASTSYGLMPSPDYSATSPDGSRAYVSGRFYDTRSNADIAFLRPGILNVSPLFSRDGRVFVLGSLYESRALDSQSGALIARLCGTNNSVPPRLASDGAVFASVEDHSDRDSQYVAVWDARDGAVLARIRAPKRSIWALDISPNGQLLATGSIDGSVRIWRVTPGVGEMSTIAANGDRESRRWLTAVGGKATILIAVVAFALVLIVGLIRRFAIKDN